MLRFSSLRYARKVSSRLSGFTMVELIIVLAILGIIFAVSSGGIIASQQKSRDGKRKSDLEQISVALETYFTDKGEYPPHGDTYKIDADGCSGFSSSKGSGGGCEWGTPFIDDKATVYMVKLPKDPQTSFAYHYESDGESFQIYARLENTEDLGVQKSGTTPMVFDGVTCGAAECNYGTSSTNTTPQEGRTLVAE